MTEIRTDFTRLQASVEETTARARELRAAGFALQQRLLATQRELAKVSAETQAILRVVHQHLASLQAKSADQNKPELGPPNAVLIALSILGRDENDLDAMTDDLIEAFKTASAAGDDEGQALFANALRLIGRHLATQIGPKAAGVVIN